MVEIIAIQNLKLDGTTCRHLRKVNRFKRSGLFNTGANVSNCKKQFIG